MNIAPFSIPGLFPTRSPISESRTFTNVDGSLSLDFYTADADDLTFSASLTTPDKKVMLMDTTGSFIFTREGEDEGTHIYTFVLDGEEAALPVGTSRLDILGENGLITYFVTNVDNPFNRGRNSGYRRSDTDRSVFVIRGSAPLTEGVTSAYIEFPRPFSVTPGLVAINIVKGGVAQAIPSSVTNVNAVGFTVATETPIPNDGVYTVEWVVWTRAAPLLLEILTPDIGPYYTDPL